MNPTSLLLDRITRTIRSIEIHAAHVSVALAPKAAWSPKYAKRPASSSSSSGTALRAEASAAPASSSNVMGKGRAQ